VAPPPPEVATESEARTWSRAACCCSSICCSCCCEVSCACCASYWACYECVFPAGYGGAAAAEGRVVRVLYCQVCTVPHNVDSPQRHQFSPMKVSKHCVQLPLSCCRTAHILYFNASVSHMAIQRGDLNNVSGFVFVGGSTRSPPAETKSETVGNDQTRETRAKRFRIRPMIRFQFPNFRAAVCIERP
jgi:hypothetical protein